MTSQGDRGTCKVRGDKPIAAKQLPVCTGNSRGRSSQALVAWADLQKDAHTEPATG